MNMQNHSLNNGGVSPSPRIVTEVLVRYQWQQEDAIAYTKSFFIGQMTQAETISSQKNTSLL
jgi:hypothetical protein